MARLSKLDKLTKEDFEELEQILQNGLHQNKSVDAHYRCETARANNSEAIRRIRLSIIDYLNKNYPLTYERRRGER